eukprot:1861025-Rhodomonas_salina.3
MPVHVCMNETLANCIMISNAGGLVHRWGGANAVCLCQCWSRGWYLRMVFPAKRGRDVERTHASC